MLAHILLTAFLSVILLFSFYCYAKRIIINGAGRIARYACSYVNQPFETVKGSIELPIIVIAHFLFAYLILKLTGLNLNAIGLIRHINFSDLLNGVLLGVGMCGLSFLLILLIIEFSAWYHSKNLDKIESYHYVSNWLNVARSGWMRHHIHTLEILPWPAAFIVTLGQVTCEELIFKGAIINYYKNYSMAFAIIWSIILFTFMQVFFMPNFKSAIFPVMGAFIVGLVSCLVYWQTHNLFPIIIAHFFLFVMAVL